MKVFELFAGIGSQTQALKNLEIAHEVIGISEIDKYAIKSYKAMHGLINNFGDITKIEKLPYCDLLTYSFPCQDISVAGKQAGIAIGTRSGLLYEVERLLENMQEKPKYLLLENVKNLVGKGHKADFDKWLNKLEEMGYRNYWKVLNAKNYGIPQNRERVFVVSIRNDIEKEYEFPKAFDNGIRLKDILENEVDEKFYINQEKTKKLIESLKDREASNTIRVVGGVSADERCVPCITPDRLEKRQNGRRFKEDGDPMFTLTSQDKHGILQVGMLDIKGNEQVRRVYADKGISPTLNTMQGGNRQPKILQENYRIRKLTPLECWRLMGFKDEQFYKAKSAGLSDNQLYKQAGNSIVVNVLEAIFKNLFLELADEEI
jgi:DNA (cytosine-5)-methyltransferase 1